MEGVRIAQSGTPRDIFSDPASDYVAEFVANMNPLGVLTARDVMRETINHAEPPGPRQDPETPVHVLMEMFAAGASQVLVEEAGTAIGTVTPESVISRLVLDEQPKGDAAEPEGLEIGDPPRKT